MGKDIKKIQNTKERRIDKKIIKVE